MKVITMLFLILLPILLSAEYEPKVIVKYPFEVERDSICPVGDTLISLADSLSRGTFLKMTIYDGSGLFAVDSGYSDDSGTVHLSYDKWNDDSPIDTADVDSVKIELPNAYRFEEPLTLDGGEPNPVEYYFATSEKMRGSIGELIDKLKIFIEFLNLDVQNNSELIGDSENQYAFRFAIMADPHIGVGGFWGTSSWDFEENGYWQPWQGTDGYSAPVITNVKRNRTVSTYLQYYNAIVAPLQFVVALGDLTDSAERAELELIRDLLDKLNIPYIPIFGNHDTWAYRYVGFRNPSGESRSNPCGHYFKDYGFGDYYETLKTMSPFGNWNETYYLNNIAEDVGANDADSYFFNFSFDYQNYHFICSDFNTRDFAPAGWGGSKGPAGILDPNWAWFWEDFDKAKAEGREIIIIDHHPLDNKTANFVSQHFPGPFEDSLDARGIDYFDYWFAGHKHSEYHTSSGYWGFVPFEGWVIVDTTCKNVISVGNSYASWCKTVTVRTENRLDLLCTLNPSGENYVFEGKINYSPGSSTEYYFNLLNEGIMLEGNGTINETYEYTSTGNETVTLDAVINGSHYTITKALEIPYANYLTLLDETVNTTKIYEATNYITADTAFYITSSGDVTMEAGNYIRLRPGFEAQDGCEFRASIDASLKDNPPALSYIQSEDLPISIPKMKIAEKPTPAQTPVKEATEEIPTVFTCAQNKPNPFVSRTTINYGLPKDSDVNLIVFNIAGQAVKTLVNATQSAGFKSVNWDGRSSAGAQVPQGIYFYVFKAGNFEKHHKMILLK